MNEEIQEIKLSPQIYKQTSALDEEYEIDDRSPDHREYQINDIEEGN